MIFVKRFGMLTVLLCVLFAGYSYAHTWNEIPSPNGFYCYDALNFSDQDIYVVGYSGSIIHYDGNEWQPMTTPTRMPIWSIWGPDPNHIYAVGGSGTILFYDGKQWSSMDSGTRQWLYSIWGTDNQTIFAAGAGVILKYNGSSWTHMMIGDDRKTFFTIYGNNDHDIYAAGDFGKIYHYNGIGWTEIKSGVSGQIWGLFTSGVHIFAAGSIANNQSTVYHFDGVQWNHNVMTTKEHFWNIWGSSENDIYLVGDSGTIITYDGQDWKTQIIDQNLRFRCIWGKLGTTYVMAENGTIVKKEADCHIQLGHVAGHAGETIRIPVSLSNTSMNPMEGIDIAIDYNPDIIAVQDVELTGGIMSDTQYTFETEFGKPGRIVLVFGATTECYIGSGVIAYLKCHILEDIGRTDDFEQNQWNTPQSVSISKAEINEKPASVHDGSITVMNYPPMISSIDHITGEEDQATINIPFSIYDTETAANELTVTVKINGSSECFQHPVIINGTYRERNIELNLLPNMFGQSDIIIEVSDGINSSQKTVSCIIQGINDPPSFKKGSDINVFEDENRQIIPNWATQIAPGPLNESDQLLEFTIETQEEYLFEDLPQLLPNGTLVFKPQPNAFGKADLMVSLTDNASPDSLSIQKSFIIHIIPVNDPPIFEPGDDITVLEDSGIQAITGWAKNIVAGNNYEMDQTIVFKVNTSNQTLFDSSYLPQINDNGDLIFSTSPNAFGTSSVTVIISDNGGSDHGGSSTSTSYPFTITILPVNDAPSFIAGSDVQIYKNSGPQLFDNWATEIKSGPQNENDQHVNFHISNNNMSLFKVQPKISENGTLTFTPEPDVTGEALVAVYLMDDAGVAHKGHDISTVERFNIIISDYPIVSGSIRYYSDNQAVRNVQLQLDGDHQYSTQSDSSGKYIFTDVKPGNYVLSATKTDDLKGLSGTDASIIFRHASESQSLNCYEMIAADVSKSGHIGGTDASRVARYRAGLTDCLNDSCLDWVFSPSTPFANFYMNTNEEEEMKDCQKWPPIAYPEHIRLHNISEDQLNIDFVAFRLGDTTGNWSPDEVPTRKSEIQITEDISEQLLHLVPDGKIQIPLEIDKVASISGIDFTVKYNADLLTALGATLSGGILDERMYDLRVNLLQKGMITGVISATKNLITSKGILVYLEFQWNDQEMSDATIIDDVHISIQELECNENQLPLKRFKIIKSAIKNTEEELLEKLKKFDIHMDNKKGLEEAIDALRSVSGFDER